MAKASTMSPSPSGQLHTALDAAVQDMPLEESRQHMILVAREYMATRKDAIHQRFKADGKAYNVLKDTSAMLDELIGALFDTICRKLGNVTLQPQVAIVAVGGYGRSEQFPFSDVDLLFIVEDKTREASHRITEHLLYILWDLGLTLGQSVRSVDECIERAMADITIRTNLLDARLLCGTETLFETFTRRLNEEVIQGSALTFVEAKLNERDQRHLRCGDSRYVLEPNVKEGKGGLRDLHTIYWLAKYAYSVRHVSELVKLGVFTEDEYKSYSAAMSFLTVVRTHLHYLAGRSEERVTFDMQTVIGEAMGYKEHSGSRSVERFMKRYFLMAKEVGNLTRTFCAMLEEEKKRKPRISIAGRLQRGRKVGSFIIDGERLTIEHDHVFDRDPPLLIELFHAAQENDLDIHPQALRQVSRSLHLINREFLKNERANSVFMQILLSQTNPEVTLRRMNEAGVLGRFIPDFGRVTGQMQYDMYHVFTVDEHTIFALGLLHNIEKGKFIQDLPLASDIIHQVKSRRVLYLALFCHDIAKGRGGDHSMLGEKVAYKMASRFGFTPMEQETTAWLVRQHLLMSRTAFKRDVADPKTIEDFVAKVQSPERLRLLLVLTVADIRAVGPTVWNGWKGSLLRDLYYHAEEKMGASKTSPQKEQRAMLAKELKILLPSWQEDEVDSYVDLGGSSFWSSNDAAGHSRIARMLKEAAVMNLPLSVDTFIDGFRSITEITICTPDQHGLFAKISGVMALTGANILNSKIFTLKNGMAVDTFWVQDAEGRAFDKPEKLAKLSTQLEMVLSGQLDLDKEFARTIKPYPSRLDVFKVPPGVFIDNNVSTNYTVIEVSGRDRIGFLFSVTKTLADLGLSISTAHITTYGERAVDVFYVKDVFGMKIYHEGKLRQIREALLSCLSPAQEELHQRAG